MITEQRPGAIIILNYLKTNFMKIDFINDDEMRDFVRLTKAEFLASYSYLTEADYEATHKLAPNFEEIKEEMEAYNADEVGLDNPITMEEAEYNLLNSDKYYYANDKNKKR